MTPQLMVQPSALMSSGIRISEFGNIYLFKFTDELQSRFEELLEWMNEMAGVYRLQITETAEELKTLLAQQKMEERV